MANQYNRFQDTDYVHMPIEAYQMALGSAESEKLQQLAQLKGQTDAFNAVEASYSPDAALKKDVIDKLYAGISDLAKRNLRSQDTLMNLSTLTNDPTTVNALANIQGNTVTYKKAIADNEAYVKESGNDININPFTTGVDAYNKLGKEGFQAGFMSGYSPGKYVDAEKEVRAVLQKANHDGFAYYDDTKGYWLVRHSGERLTEAKLRSAGYAVLDDPKYIRQLRLNADYISSKSGGIGVYNANHAASIENNTLPETIKNIADLEIARSKALKAKKPDVYSKDIQDLTEQAVEYKKRANGYRNSSDNGMLAQDMRKDIVNGAMAGLPFEKDNINISVNPYKMEEIKQANRLATLRYKHKLDAPPVNEELQYPVFSGAAGQYMNGVQQQFTKRFGDLSINPDGSATTKQWGDDSELGKFGNTFYNMLKQTSADLGIYTPEGQIDASTGKMKPFSGSTQSKEVNPKVLEFSSFLRGQGIPVDNDLLMLKGSTPASAKEYAKLADQYKAFADGTNSNPIAGLGVGLNAGFIDPAKLGSYFMNSIVDDGMMVENEKGERVPISNITGKVGKDDNIAVINKWMNTGRPNGVMQPGTNKIAIASPDGSQVFYIKPDVVTQQFNGKLMNVLNPNGSIGRSNTHTHGVDLPVTSIGLYKKDGSFARETFPVMQSSQVPGDIEKGLNEMFKTGKNMDIANIPAGEARLYYKEGNNVIGVPYQYFLQNKDAYIQQHNLNSEGNSAVIVSKDPSGHYDILSLDPAMRSQVTPEMLLQNTMGEISNGSFKHILKGDNKDTRILQDQIDFSDEPTPSDDGSTRDLQEQLQYQINEYKKKTEDQTDPQ